MPNNKCFDKISLANIWTHRELFELNVGSNFLFYKRCILYGDFICGDKWILAKI